MISVYSRQCTFSEVSKNKQRPEWFSRKECFDNLVSRFNDYDTNFHIVYDCGHLRDNRCPEDSYIRPYLKNKNFQLTEINGGSEAASFLSLLQIILKDADKHNLEDDEIIYIVEDDYLHKPNSLKVLRDAFRIPGIHYVSLYDHPDKYDPLYLYTNQIDPFMTRLYVGQHCHYRAAISTTNTYAMRLGTLKKDLDFHLKYSTNVPVTLDHYKFLTLLSNGRNLVTAIPSYSAHLQIDTLPPLFKREDYVRDS